MDHPGFKLHWETSLQQKITYLLLYAWTEQVRDLNAFLFTKPYSVLSIDYVVVHPSWPLASKDVFMCHILLVIDHTHHGSKVSSNLIRKSHIFHVFIGILGQWHHTSNQSDTGYRCVIVSYSTAFWNIAWFCPSKRPFQTTKHGAAWILEKKVTKKRGSGSH